MKKLLKSKRGEGYFDIVIVVLVVVMVIALIMAVAPVVSAKIQLDNYADELVREAEISGRIGNHSKGAGTYGTHGDQADNTVVTVGQGTIKSGAHGHLHL